MNQNYVLFKIYLPIVLCDFFCFLMRIMRPSIVLCHYPLTRDLINSMWSMLWLLKLRGSRLCYIAVPEAV